MNKSHVADLLGASKSRIVGFSTLSVCVTWLSVGCQSLDTQSLSRGGEPTAAQKHATAVKRTARTPDHPALGQVHAPAETKTLIATIGGVRVYKSAPFPAVFYKHGLNVDADGSPFAYHPKPDDGKGLDYLADAGHPGNWWGIATSNGSDSGTPVVQGPSDPAPGFYVSTTSLEDPQYPPTNPRCYVNASEIPFIVLPLRHNFGGHLGDIGAVVNFKNGKVAYVIAADEGPPNQLGEGSVALAKALGVNPSARSGGTDSGIGYCFFPGSGNRRPQTLAQINKTGSELFAKFGGAARLERLLESQ